MNELITAYSAAKSGLAESWGASEDLLHVHAGLLIFFLAALLFRRRMRSPVPIALVYAFALGNEVVDALAPGGRDSTWEPVLDILNTIVWPTLLFMLARRSGKAGQPDHTV